MLTILILGLLAVAGITAARLAGRAFEAEHLLVLRQPDGAALLFERDGDRRYHPLPWSRLPGALCRFACGVRAAVRVRGDA
jgi:hypothetical protein